MGAQKRFDVGDDGGVVRGGGADEGFALRLRPIEGRVKDRFGVCPAFGVHRAAAPEISR